VKDAIELAAQISKKSPVAMSGIKHNLNYSRDHSGREGLEYMVGLWSSICSLGSMKHLFQLSVIKPRPIERLF